ncbi:FFLEELY motif protein [Acidovorax lacteus]|uniref:DUF8198 domain-containing protein n=1 Tax=Acidovorax lacteus TaxID=1924988 RepID=A0ABP8KZK3_9BURK
MDAAQTIRNSIADVQALRRLRTAEPGLGDGVAAVKTLQSRRFAGTYADLMASPRFGAASRFFLEELYSDRDYSDRDQQFSRIAGTLQTLFPQPVVGTAVALAELHAQTETLDHDMGRNWLAGPAAESPALRYARAWQAVGQPHARRQQLERVLGMGQDLARLTRTPGLRMMLRMMRGPAEKAGMGALQRFLEAGFDTFGAMARERGAVDQFLQTIAAREKTLMDLLFQGDPVTCETELHRTLGQAR